MNFIVVGAIQLTLVKLLEVSFNTDLKLTSPYLFNQKPYLYNKSQHLCICLFLSLFISREKEYKKIQRKQNIHFYVDFYAKET